MASTAGKDGGIVSQSQGPDLSQKGVWSAKEQQSYRQQVVGKTFEKDTGYLANQIKALNQINKIYSEQLAKLDAADKKQAKAYQKRMAENTNLKTQLEKIYEEQEGSIEAIQEIVHNSNKQLKKSYKELGDSAALALENASKRGKRAAKEHLAEITRLSNNAITQGKEIEVTLKNAEKATKTMSKGLSETLNSFSSNLKDLTNMINIQRIADNEYTQKVNERYEIINNLNKTLGLDLAGSTSAYNSITSEFRTFNNNIGNLFNIDDMREYMKASADLGITNRDAMEANMKQSIIANKYMGLSYDVQESLFKYMKTSNNNDAIASYNKLMITLTRENVGYSKDMLSELIKSGQDTSDILAAAGVDVTKYTEGKAAMAATLQDKYGMTSEEAQRRVGMIDTAIQDLYQGNYAALAGQGININTLNTLAQRGDFESLYNLVIGSRGATTSKSRGIGYGLIGMGEYNRALGRDISGEANLQIYGTETSNNISSLLDTVDNMSDEQEEQYTEQNSAISDLTRWSNKNNVFLEDTFGNSKLGWLNYSNMATAFFGLALASNVIQGVSAFMNIFGISGGSKLGKLLGISESGGLGKLLGTAGPIALGIASVAAGVKAGWDLWNRKQSEKFSEGQAIASGMEKTLTERGVSAGSAAFQAGISGLSEKGTGTGLDKGYMSNKVAQELGIDKSIWKSPAKEFKDTANKYAKEMNWQAYNKLKLGQVFFSDSLDSKDDENMLLALLMTLNLQNKHDNAITSALKDILGTNISYSDSDIKDILKTRKVSLSRVQDGLNTLQKNNIFLATDAGYFFSYSDINDMYKKFYSGDSELEKISGYHKAGLNWVPKDNYRALLHKGEMILPEDEAKVYRELKSGVGGESDSLYANQQKILYNKIVPASADVTGIGKEFGLPAGWTVTTAYGTYTNLRDKAGRRRQHRGIDFAAAQGTQMRAANSGLVTFSGSSSGFGNMVVIKDDKTGLYNRYGHAYKLIAKTGDHVNAGDLIALVGSTGNSTGPHLHYQVDRSTNYRDDVNPWPYATLSIFGGSGSIGAGNVTVTPGASTSVSGAATSARLTPSTAGKRVLPGIGGPIEDRESPMNRITNSIDGVSSKIIKYLDEVRAEQAEQKRLINILQSSQAESSF